MTWFQRLVSVKGHATYLGVVTLINKLYQFDNSGRLETWMSRVQLWIYRVKEDSTSNEQHISLTKKNGVAVSYRVTLPSAMSVAYKNFNFSTHGNKEAALAAAITYRDDSIKQLLDGIGDVATTAPSFFESEGAK
jgi:hypothetical protein